jgi:hypothetical protein
VADVTVFSAQLALLHFMSAFEAVTILVTAGGVLIGLVAYFRTGGPLTELGRHGVMWFEHPLDRPIEDRPSEDERDAPIPRRPF